MADPISAESNQADHALSQNSANAVTEPSDVLSTEPKPAPAKAVRDEQPAEERPEKGAAAPPEADARHLRSVDGEVEAGKAVAPAETFDWAAKIEALQGEVKEARALVDTLQAEDVARREKAREALMVEEYGMLDPDYMKIPSFPSAADATTTDGREELRQWMVKHPALFGKSPAITQEMKETAKSDQIKIGAQPWRWSDIWKG